MALVLENRRGVMEHKRKLVRQHQPSSSSKARVATVLSWTYVSSCSAAVSAKATGS
jgi:hypothetical protein